MEMRDCPKFHGCSAPICPLDPNWRKRKYLRGEPVCPWLSEYSKADSRANLGGAIGVKLYGVISEVYPDIYPLYGALKSRLDRSANTPSRLGDGQ